MLYYSFLCFCTRMFFRFEEKVRQCQKCMCYGLFKTFELTFSLFQYVVSHMSYPLGHSTVKSSVYMYIYLGKIRWITKRVTNVMLLTNKIYKKFFILWLISSNPTLWEFFYFTYNQQKLQSIIFFSLWLDQQSSQNVEKEFFWRNIKNFFRVDFFCFSGFASSVKKDKKKLFCKKL